MKRNQPVIEFRCNKCGAPQPRDEEMSRPNWNVYKNHTLCQCGGKFVMWIDGQPLDKPEAGKEPT